jgi:peptidoglycan hydrolase-like protein with peptidoglycan-binding domain
VTAVVLLGGLVAIWLLTRNRDAVSVGWMTAVAQRGTLTETVDASFTMVRDHPERLRAPVSGVITDVDIRQGAPLPTLKRLFAVAGKSVFGLPSSRPLYRDIGEGDRGDDVKAVQRALAAAGHDPGSTSGKWDPRTTDAFKAFQRDMHLDQTGRLLLRQFVSFPPGSTALDPPVLVGAEVVRGGVIAVLGKPTGLVAEAEVSQLDLPRLKANQAAELTFDALPGRSVGATVATLPTRAKQTEPTPGSTKPVVYPVRLVPRALPQGVRADMTGQARVIVVQRPEAVIVPTAAVGGGTADPVVNVVTGDRVQRRPVKVGLATSTGTQILSGLEPGTTVIVGRAPEPETRSGPGADDREPPALKELVR